MTSITLIKYQLYFNAVHVTIKLLAAGYRDSAGGILCLGVGGLTDCEWFLWPTCDLAAAPQWPPRQSDIVLLRRLSGLGDSDMTIALSWILKTGTQVSLSTGQGCSDRWHGQLILGNG